MAYHFEIHLTIDNLAPQRIAEFEQVCQQLSGKAVLIELPVGEHTQQPMFTFTQNLASLAEVFAKIEPIKQRLNEQNFPVIRTKVEIPTNQAESFLAENPDIYGYFEWHGKIEWQSLQDLAILKSIAINTNSHLSTNAVRNQQNQRFLTLRQKLDSEFLISFAYQKEHFYQKTQQIIQQLQQYSQFDLLKSQHELCIFDDKISLDTGWIE